MNIYLIIFFGIFCFAARYVFDKYILSSKVRNENAYLTMLGIVYIIYSIIIAVFLDWKNVTWNNFILPIVIGIGLTINMILYAKLLKKEDISYVAGLEYTYPIIVVLLSFIFLEERFGIMAYLGVISIILGGLVISYRLKKIKLRTSVWMFILLVVTVGLMDFTVKISTNTLDGFKGALITLITFGVLQSIYLFNKRNLKAFKKQWDVWKYAIITGALGVMGWVFYFIAMMRAPATVVSSLATTQAFFVLIIESFTDKYIRDISRDKTLLFKFVGIALIVAGVILLIANT